MSVSPIIHSAHFTPRWYTNQVQSFITLGEVDDNVSHVTKVLTTCIHCNYSMLDCYRANDLGSSAAHI